jgi:hypothetical protein
LRERRPIAGQEKWIVQNAKPDHPVSPKTGAAPSHRHKQGVLKDGSSADGPRSSQRKTRPTSETSTNDKAKPGVEKSLEDVVVEQDRVPEAKVETKTEVGTSSQWLLNQTIRFLWVQGRRGLRGPPRPGWL